ncbi:MAG: YkgJ family cysteine cluster protein [Acidobacteriia bacterium]|nr:YkgJ family cysteine cluster protein [Terriglobia bacterium]
MAPLARLEPGDRTLVQILDTAMAEAARKSGDWLACRLGCVECCMGPFPITQLDALRLRAGLAELAGRDPQRAVRVRQRAQAAVERLSGGYPGDASTGRLDEGEEAEERFAAFADDEPCPALDPETGACDLYAARPATCRIFGPAVRAGGGPLGVCELCYRGASDEEIAACEVEPDPGGLEDALLEELEKATGRRGQTIVAFALRRP